MRKTTAITSGGNKIRVYVAEGFFTRLRGLIGRNLEEEEGLLLSPCRGIHCMFMSYPIDVIYLTREKRVLRIDRSQKPWSVGKTMRGCQSVLEMKSGSAERFGLIVGSILTFSK